MASDAPSRADRGDRVNLPPSFPANDYTPHGYIDNPYHTMVLNPSGVVRSVPPLGFGYWLRTFSGAYGTGTRPHVNYLSLLQMSVAYAERRIVDATDFADHNLALSSRYHTKHMMSYDWVDGDLTFSFRYFLPREHVLACRVEIANASGEPQDVCLHATHVYGLWEIPWWGSNGIGMRYAAASDAAVSAVWAYGDYFALGATEQSAAHKATASREIWRQWLRDNDLTSIPEAAERGAGPLHTVCSYRLTVAGESTATALICLGRGVNEPGAVDELQAGRQGAVPELRRQLDRDEAFWSHCPQLEGDWPALWKRGWVYDWETLRMNIRQPIGIFKHAWDAMQVHSPRSVLGEAALDSFAMSHADADLAKDVLYGTFVDAPQPNVPCCREDGSMNMVAADGEACGSAPSWCFPFHVIRAVYTSHPDSDWLRRLYPHLKIFLDWWLENRTDEHGWVHCHCDWESGQDSSKRFPTSEGDLADVVRTVDVTASMAEAFANMAAFAQITGADEDVPRWSTLADRWTTATRELFVDGWFRDSDTRANRPILLDYLDVMMLSPLTCDVATAEQVDAIRPKLQYFRDHPEPWLEWPSFFLAYTEAAWTAGTRILAAEATADIADRIYPRIDQRGLRFADSDQPYTDYRIPGVACEYWPVAEDTEPGGENYGWGATLPLYIIRNILGFRETQELDTAEFFLAPSLPRRLLEPGRSYRARQLRFRGVGLSVRYDVCPDDRLHVTLAVASRQPIGVAVLDDAGQLLAAEAETSERGECTFDCENGQVLKIRLEM